MIDQATIDRAKSKDCIQYLESRGYKPQSAKGRMYKYFAPWRPEDVPSVCVYVESNSFSDFGDKEKSGSVIQLCMAVERLSFQKAVEVLLGEDIRPASPIEHRTPENPINIIYIVTINSDFLKDYLKTRCIPLNIARKYCKELRIEMRGDDGPYRKTLVGFQSMKGGWEMRNQYSKISNSPKYYTEINPGQREVVIFEGFFDYLSYVTLKAYEDTKSYIVLNSVSFVSYIDFSRFDLVHYYGDNDSAGDKTFQTISQQVSTIDHRKEYEGFNDLNQYHTYVTHADRLRKNARLRRRIRRMDIGQQGSL